MRTQSTDAAVQIAPKIDFSLEESMEYIQVDEYLEITPESLRMRKLLIDSNFFCQYKYFNSTLR